MSEEKGGDRDMNHKKIIHTKGKCFGDFTFRSKYATIYSMIFR